VVRVIGRLAVLLAVVALAACSSGGDDGPDGPCRDAVVPSSAVPGGAEAQGITSVVGTAGVWFIAPELERWGDAFEAEGDGYRGKLPLWVDGDDLPSFRVRPDGPGTEGVGSVEADPTADGLPGPLPATVRVPGPGCWEVTATTPAGAVTIRARVG
jgi:hypothetical protein